MALLLTPLKAAHSGCLNCPPKALRLDLRRRIDPGFGYVTVLRDGKSVLGGLSLLARDAERMAAADPEHDWRVHVSGPLSGITYQRHGLRKWLAVETDQGFA